MRSSPYWPVLTHPLLRRVLPGVGASYLGDGMAVLAVGWLAIELAPEGQRGTGVALAVAAYTLPGAAGVLLFGRVLGGRSGAQLAGWDATLRACALGAIPVAYLFGALSLGLYVGLLALSSLLHPWGSAGRYTLLAEVLPRRHHLAANATVATLSEAGTVAGPPLAGFLADWNGAALVIAVDAVTFAILAATYHLAVPRRPRVGPTPADRAGASRAAGFGAIRRDRTLLGLLTLSFMFFLLFGPAYVALPLHVVEDLHGSATLLGLYYTAFGIGAVLGGLLTGYLRALSLWPTTIGVVVGFGVAMLPLGLGAPPGVGMASFAVGGLIWAPYMSTSIALYQRTTSTAMLPRVLAANGAVTALSVPLGTLLGGPLVATVGAQGTLLLSAVGTVTLGLGAACIAVAARRRTPATPARGHLRPLPPG
jgi:MFS transporter, DHA3 family, macrolide efflux protein